MSQQFQIMSKDMLFAQQLIGKKLKSDVKRHVIQNVPSSVDQ